MGQYHVVVNHDKKEYIHPHKFGSGLKLGEFGSEGRIGFALVFLLAEDDGGGGGDFHSDGEYCGHWAGDRIAIVGDYGSQIGDAVDSEGYPINCYRLCSDEINDYGLPDHLVAYNDISDDVIHDIQALDWDFAGIQSIDLSVSGWR
jgi:hypothetical protein